MNKARTKCREIHFRSGKNGKVLCVHSAAERAYAKLLEEELSVVSYEACAELDRERYPFVNPLGIRKGYFDTDWTSDFVIHFMDGSIGIRELVSFEDLAKRAELEKLEFSRRYWAAEKIRSWKIVIMEKGA